MCYFFFYSVEFGLGRFLDFACDVDLYLEVSLLYEGSVRLDLGLEFYHLSYLLFGFN